MSAVKLIGSNTVSKWAQNSRQISSFLSTRAHVTGAHFSGTGLGHYVDFRQAASNFLPEENGSLSSLTPEISHLRAPFRYSILPAISLDGLLDCTVLEGAFNVESFTAFIAHLLDRMQPWPASNSASSWTIVLYTSQLRCADSLNPGMYATPNVLSATT